jgi:hypothetical protein
MEDERLGLPSASSIERISLCPGSHRLELTAPRRASGDSDAGEAAHELAALYFRLLKASGDWPSFNPDFVAKNSKVDISIAIVVGQFIAMAKEVHARWIETIGAEYDGTDVELGIIIEERIIWSDAAFKVITTGKPDVIWVWGRHALVLDLKSLYGEQTESVNNLQLRVYAILTNEEYQCTSITVAICQPRVVRTPQTAYYAEDQIQPAKDQIIGFINAALEPDAPLVAGPKQCRLCAARSFCPAAAEYAGLPEVVPDHALKRGEGKKLAVAMTLQQRIVLWRKKATIEKILEEVQESLMALPSAELAAAGLFIEFSRGDRTVTDTQAAYAAVQDKLTVDQFNACSSVKISALEDVFRAATGLPVADSRADLEKRLGSILTRKKDKRSLVYKAPAPAATVATTQPAGAQDPPAITAEKPQQQPTLELT